MMMIITWTWELCVDHLRITVCLYEYEKLKRYEFTKPCTVSCNRTNQVFRLVGGSTYREGRVEVCMDGYWGTVCDNSQEGIAGAVCSQLGFPAEGSLYHNTVCNIHTLCPVCMQMLEKFLNYVH